jgi:Domain of unknown function (DUF397)
MLPSNEGLSPDYYRIIMCEKSTDEPAWRASRKCESGACVQVGMANEEILLRGTADPHSPRIAVSRDGWQGFVTRVKNGDFDCFNLLALP